MKPKHNSYHLKCYSKQYFTSIGVLSLFKIKNNKIQFFSVKFIFSINTNIQQALVPTIVGCLSAFLVVGLILLLIFLRARARARLASSDQQPAQGSPKTKKKGRQKKQKRSSKKPPKSNSCACLARFLTRAVYSNLSRFQSIS